MGRSDYLWEIHDYVFDFHSRGVVGEVLFDGEKDRRWKVEPQELCQQSNTGIVIFVKVEEDLVRYAKYMLGDRIFV